ncbi:VIT1/CCC1 transporter family protein [Patulibacter sp. SYSU D01012]|uniref:VIT1/CCC1 transporter family protein n=1 Tax=Patulibacter sp. SYSU D01012 TaxID=2817381 RepID=UPI001B304A95|nr:VIT1/CCC1 transporter family protein [Patulibacter sp. SYSU D01012]
MTGRGPTAGWPARRHVERHRSGRANWLRAAVLGANDGIVSTASLLLGVAGSGAGRSAVLTAGLAGMAAGAFSMAAGEYVSVSSQRDTEAADIALEARELADDPAGELDELTALQRERGLPPELARRVAEALTERDALAAHVRDELGLADARRARPLQAAGSSAVAFAAGAALPLAAALTAHVLAIVAVACVALAVLGALGARLGGAPAGVAALRVAAWGVAAMAATYGIGALVGGV